MKPREWTRAELVRYWAGEARARMRTYVRTRRGLRNLCGRRPESDPRALREMALEALLFAKMAKRVRVESEMEPSFPV